MKQYHSIILLLPLSAICISQWESLFKYRFFCVRFGSLNRFFDYFDFTFLFLFFFCVYFSDDIFHCFSPFLCYTVVYLFHFTFAFISSLFYFIFTLIFYPFYLVFPISRSVIALLVVIVILFGYIPSLCFSFVFHLRVHCNSIFHCIFLSFVESYVCIFRLGRKLQLAVVCSYRHFVCLLSSTAMHRRFINVARCRQIIFFLVYLFPSFSEIYF